MVKVLNITTIGMFYIDNIFINMNRSPIVDIEFKLRQISEKNIRFHNLTPDEKIMIPGLRSVAQEEIKELMRKDLKAHLPALHLQKSRDISHLKDLSSPKVAPSYLTLPTDISQLKNIVESRTLIHNKTKPALCSKKKCIKRLICMSPQPEIHAVDYLENIDEGIPTGRKDIQNLLAWFTNMKENYGKTEDFETVITVCGQELLKQVKVQCKHRGYLLKIILRYYKSILTKKKAAFEAKLATVEEFYEGKISDLTKENTGNMQRFEMKIKELLNKIDNHVEIQSNLKDELENAKKRLQDTQRMHIAEQDIWKKRILMLMQDTSGKKMAFTNESYRLAVARWRKDLFTQEIEDQPELEIPLEIRRKIENAEQLTSDELGIYREIYYKDIEERNKQKFCEAACQTEEFETENADLWQGLSEMPPQNYEYLEAFVLRTEPVNKIVNVEQTIANIEEQDEKVLVNKLPTKTEVSEKETQTELELELEPGEGVFEQLGLLFTMGEANELENLIEEDKTEESLQSEDSADISNSSDKSHQSGEETERPANVSKEHGSQEFSDVGENDYINNSIVPHVDSIPKIQQLDRHISQVYAKRQQDQEKGTEGSKDINKIVQKSRSTREEKHKRHKQKQGKRKEQDVGRLLDSEHEIDPENQNLYKTDRQLEGIKEQFEKESGNSNDIKLPPSENINKKKYTYNVESEDRALVTKFTSNYKIKRESFLSADAHTQQRRKSESSSIQTESKLIQSVLQGKLGPTLQKTTKGILSGIFEKQNELKSLDQLIQSKKKQAEDIQEALDRSTSIHKRRSSAMVHSSLSPVSNSSPVPRGSLKFQISAISTRRSQDRNELTADLQAIDEEDVIPEVLPPEGFESESWKAGYIAGFREGQRRGFEKGKDFGMEEGHMEGYLNAVRELRDNHDQESVFGRDESQLKNSGIHDNTAIGKLKKAKGGEIKGFKEPTKIFAFTFNKQKILGKRPNANSVEAIAGLMKKLPESLKKGSKLSRKMIFKMISGLYLAAYTQILSEGISDLLLICYDDLTQKYGLKKVSDRKFLDLISSVIKNKDRIRCRMFLQLTSLGNWGSSTNFSKFTLLLYLESYHYMINSKIGIVTEFDETEDKLFFPLNRAIECAKEKLEGKIDKPSISMAVSMIEHKSVPDPRKINLAIVELETVLEIMCGVYETIQGKIKGSVEKIFNAMGFDQAEPIPDIFFSMTMRVVAAGKYNKVEELNLKETMTLEEITEICIHLSIFHDTDLNNIVKSYPGTLYENYSELLGLIENIESRARSGARITKEQWQKLLSECMINHKIGSDLGCVIWVIYESEIKRLSIES